MEFLDSIAIYPSAQQVVLLKVILGLMLVIHIPYMSIIMGSTLFSLAFSVLDKREPNPTHLRFSRDLINLASSTGTAPILLGILPLITMVLAFGQLYQGTELKMSSYVLIVTVCTIAGFIFLNIFKKSFENRETQFYSHLVSGLVTVGVFFGGYLIFASAISLIFFPEKWPFVQGAFPLFVYENVLPRHALFIFFTLALTGAAILYFFFKWPDRKTEFDPEYAGFVKKVCSGITLLFVLLMPIIIAWNLLTFPDVAASEAVFGLWIVVLLLLMVTSVLLFSSISRGSYRFTTVCFLLLLMTFGVISVNDQIAAGNASFEHHTMLTKQAQEVHETIIAEREARMQAATQVDGETIYKNICSACHMFDQRVVGPPYNDVLSKYTEDQSALIEFILNPKKVNPDYPPMPNQGLNKVEAEAVAKFLLEQFSQTQ